MHHMHYIHPMHYLHYMHDSFYLITYITLHCIASHCVTLQFIAITIIYILCITLHCITFHYSTLHHITSYHITSHFYITLHYINFYISILQLHWPRHMPGKIVPVTSASNIALKRNLRGEGRGWGFTFKKKLKRNIVLDSELPLPC